MRTETLTICSVCDEIATLPAGKKDDIELVKCAGCHTMRVKELDPQDYAAMYTAGWYQDTHMDTVVERTNAERHAHDKEVALLRLASISKYKSSGVLFDVGCSNGAFVDAALDAGFDAWGCDLSDAAFEHSPAFAKGRLRISEINDFGWQRRQVDVLVMNDVVEHLLEPKKTFRQANGLLKRDGVLIIDMPDFGVPMIVEGLDYHHVKPKEHIWYPTPAGISKVLEQCDFEILEIVKPIDGKIVIYARPNPNTVLDVRVWGPTGLGDMHWILLKLEALKTSEAPCTIRLTIPGYGDPGLIFRAAGFLRLIPFLDQVDMDIDEPVMVDEGSKDLAVPHYRMITNGHIERGHRVETWYPHLATNYDYPVNIPEIATEWAAKVRKEAGRNLIVIYTSSDAWNQAVSNGKGWGSKQWMALIEEINASGSYPVLIGKGWDTDFAKRLKVGTLVDLIGKTSEAQMLSLFKECDAVVGICSGATILSVHMKARSIVFWPEKDVTVGASIPMHKGFQDDWVDPAMMERGDYLPLSIGTFGVEDVMERLKMWEAV